MSLYSFSQIGVYQQCPKKYQYQYIDKLQKEFKSSPDLILGTSLHGGLERLYQQVNIFKLPNKEDVLNKFYELWNTGIKEAGDKLLYKGDQTFADYVRRGEYYINEYYDKYYPFDGTKVIGTELKLYFSLSLTNTCINNFYGIIDRLDKDGDDTFIINDYKTNKNLLPKDREGYREQLNLYGLGVKQKYGKHIEHIKAKIYYLHFSQLDEWEITDDILYKIIDKYSKLINEIEIAKIKYAESFNSNMRAFPYKSNIFCKFCEYRTLCPLFRSSKKK